MKKAIVISVFVFLTILAIVFLFLKKNQNSTPYYFIAIHNEPAHSEPFQKDFLEDSFVFLEKMVKVADDNNVKLTLMFTPQWVTSVFSDPIKMKKLEEWQKAGHEIGAHHHSVYHGNWDGYSDYSQEEILEKRKMATKSSEKYLGTLNDMMKVMFKINPNIKAGCMNEEGDKNEMPSEIVYGTCSSWANFGEAGNFLDDGADVKKGVNDFITTGTWEGIKKYWLAHAQIPTMEKEEVAENIFSKMNDGSVFGTVFHSNKEEFPAFLKYINFLNSRGAQQAKSKTVSQVIEGKILPEKNVEIKK